MNRALKAANIYTIPQTCGFLDKLAQAICNGDLPETSHAQPKDLDLTHYTLLLPTRRACRSMRDAFLRISGGVATLLPRIQPIGEVDEDVALLASAIGPGLGGPSVLDIPSAIGDVERKLILTELVLKWSETLQQHSVDATGQDIFNLIPKSQPSQALLLASELIRLMDEVETEQADLSKLAEIVPDQFSQHWALTLNFLQIVTQMWPAFLQEKGVCSPMQRRNLLLQSEAKRLRRFPPQTPVIAAGITGSIPAAAELLKVIADLPKSAVVLPGLDMALDQSSWDQIVPHHPEHPQYSMKKLLDRLEVSRNQVRYVVGTDPNVQQKMRLRLISETMRPAETTDRWQDFIRDTTAQTTHKELEKAFAELTYSVAPSAEDEAEAVALMLRYVAEMPGKTAALVTSDRILGRRVSTRLMKWGLMVDDSAGRPLTKTVPGVFMDLVAQVIASQFGASELMSLLKHPLFRVEMEPGKVRAAARSLELIALRQPLAGQGLGAMRMMLERTWQAFEQGEIYYGILRRLGTRDWERASALLDKLEAAFAPWLELYKTGVKGSLKVFAEVHIAAAEALACDPEGSSDTLWSGEAGETLTVTLSGFLQEDVSGPKLTAAEYPEFYSKLMIGQAMRPQTPVHPRLFIWGPLEARLQQPDVVILGGLNDGVWPQLAQGDPWLSRPMRTALSLPAPEQRIGLFAHDFAQMLGGQKIYLTRAAKVDGVPTVPSRWLLRLQALLKGLGLEKALKEEADEPWLAWARSRDKVELHQPISAPAPCPPVAKRPRQLSVTKIEDWLKNPYIIFARDILRLEPLTPLGAGPDAALRGQVIHQALHYFTQTYPHDLPENSAEILVQFAHGILGDFALHPQVEAFWQPRFKRFAKWFAETEPTRRKDVIQILTEQKGLLTFDAPGGAFTLTARADRLDILENGTMLVRDYKSGGFPKDKEVLQLRAPQLPLEAAIALKGGFKEIGKSQVKGLSYISASGGEPAGQDHLVNCDDAQQLAHDALDKLKKLVTSFDDPAMPYRALRRLQFDYRYDAYAHLARVAEWSSSGVTRDENSE